MATPRGRKLSAAQTQRLIGDYSLYRFGRRLPPKDLASRLGVSAQAVESLLHQGQISDDDLRRIAEGLDVGPDLLRGLAGYRALDEDTLRSLDEFFRATEQGKAQRAA